ncbi:MAG: ABC transporter permease subunit [SAR324 cluster bacterium]|nr:ABC transporter permease subunit [SAR324 cluster bacterium]
MPAPPTADEAIGNEMFQTAPQVEKLAPFSAEDPKIIRTFQRAKRIDLMARWGISAGGILVIFCVVGMMVFIAAVGMPLFITPSVAKLSQFDRSLQEKILAVGVDEYLETGFSLDQRGVWSFYYMKDGKVFNQVTTKPVAKKNLQLHSIETYDNKIYSLLWADGSTTVTEVKFLPKFNEGVRTITHQINRIADFPAEQNQQVLQSFARISGEDDSKRVTLVRQLGNNKIQVIQQLVEEDLMGNTEEKNYSNDFQYPLEDPITVMTVDRLGNAVYAGTQTGQLLQWNISEPGEASLVGQVQAFENAMAITALAVVFGESSVAVGDEKGNLTVWFPGKIQKTGEPGPLKKVHIYDSYKNPIARLLPSTRNKSFTSLDEGGNIRLNHMTSERKLLDLSSAQPYRIFGFSTRDNGLVTLDDHNQISLWELDIPHPEVSWRTLFGEVWYEGYQEPEHIWQSSASTDDFEPKFSLTTLVFGSLKGTFYAMVFSIPLALFGAIYTSEFCKDTYRRYLKPGIEIMAAMPSVIIGFLIALWLAPIVEQYVISFFLSTLLIPLVTVFFLFVWQAIRENPWCKRIEGGYEFLLIVPVIIFGCWLSVVLQAPIERMLFNGNFQLWLYQETGMRYDQRNSIIIGYGLGFLVIPLIFTICDDALTNVPKSLKAASLSLGASRWQTLWRVVLPSASPGIFAAIIIGFGRAIGETMVVLMATGNTPIMDWSVFNGMRTLAANIAVELPEAPVDGTLYRILFLSGALLFLITFFLNTFAEVIRQRLRKSYGQF